MAIPPLVSCSFEFFAVIFSFLFLYFVLSCLVLCFLKFLCMFLFSVVIFQRGMEEGNGEESHTTYCMLIRDAAQKFCEFCIFIIDSQ